METRAAQKLVLVVEDDPDLRESLGALLEDEGLAAVPAVHGQHAIDWLGSSPERPCVILLDLMMPVVNGWQFLAWMQKQGPELRSIPIVVLSAGKNRESVAGLGAAEFVAKPIDLSRLLEIVERHCRRG